MSAAVLLIAHGSRRPEANQDLMILAELLRQSGSWRRVVPCFLELAEPDIPAGGRLAAESGADLVLMMPYFLSAGAHVTSDLEEFRLQLSNTHAGCRFVLCPHLGLHPLMLQIVNDRLYEGLAAAPPS